MPHIHLTTFIAAPAEKVFDLSRSINLHKISMQDANEEAVAGVTTGLINENETVTWKAKHLFKTRFYTSKVTSMQSPIMFVDEMVKGDFKSFRHQHYFKQIGNGTILIDIVDFDSPYGFIGKMLNKFHLKKYVQNLLIKRNDVVKEYAESNKWQFVLN
ncbi:MAG TPA: SRPBCC family protein [Ferruginibacter sp.]|jgi:ligand-binding SRPBCC domain-containing protein|nr:SRPBCC family protein [Ferruginibacter sp.]